jgi:hypothetical protein
MHPALLPRLSGRVPRWVWHGGRQYYSMPELARLRNVTRWAAFKWATRRPYLCLEFNGHLYARKE